MIYCEALVTETKTIIKDIWFDRIRSEKDLIGKIHNNIVYSRLLDEFLNVFEYEQLTDNISTIFIFKLKPQMYTMADAHYIGLKNFDNAYLIVEFIF